MTIKIQTKENYNKGPCKMIYCAIDTSTDWCNIGLYKNKSLIKKIEKDPKNIWKCYQFIFSQLKSQLGEKKIDVLAVSMGLGLSLD